MLSQEACHQLMLGLVMSHLDYVNAILINLPQREIQNYKEYKIWLLKLYYIKASMKVHKRVYGNYIGSQYIGIYNIRY